MNYIVLSCQASFAFACGFIFIEKAKIVVGSTSLTQPLLLYSGSGPAMLDNICGVIFLSFVINYIVLLLCMIYVIYSACFRGSPFGEAAKTDSSKKIKIIYSPINRWIWDPIFVLVERILQMIHMSITIISRLILPHLKFLHKQNEIRTNTIPKWERKIHRKKKNFPTPRNDPEQPELKKDVLYQLSKTRHLKTSEP
jgi:hypothetical protein